MPNRSSTLRILLFVVAALGLAMLLHLGRGTVVDRDAFYHFRHATLYWQRGPLLADFPWAAYSVMQQERSDLWYGFHLLLAPLALVPDPILGLKLAGVLVLWLSLALTYAALRRLELRWPELWTLVLVIAGAPAMVRELSLRPQVVTVGLLALLFALLLRGKPWQAGLVAAAMAWVHLSLSGLALGVAVAVLGWEQGLRRKASWITLAWIAGGLVVGWTLRPNPLGAARLVYLQLALVLQLRAQGVHLLGARELLPAPLGDIFLGFLPFLVLWLAGLPLALRNWREGKDERIALGSAAVLSLLFFVLTLAHSVRWADPWRIFALISTALAWEQVFGAEPRVRWAPAVVGGLTVAMAVSLVLEPNRRVFTSGFAPDRLRGVSGWLAANSPRDAIVFHARWESFAELFFWNQGNRYINGMDPLFLYARSEPRYWEMHHLGSGAASRMTAAGPTPNRMNLDYTPNVLRRDFDAKYLLVESDQRELLYFARHSPDLAPRYDDAAASVFEVVPRQSALTRSNSRTPSAR
jgi:hypothetical protein